MPTALNCDLRIELVPRSEDARSGLSKEDAARRFRRLFWDRDLTAGDLGRYPEWIVERVLEYGELEDVEAARRLYGRRRFLKLVAAAERVSPRTRAFWRQVLESEGIECTRRYSRPAAWN